MSLVNVVNMVVLDNPTLFVKPFQFEVTFECLQALEDDLEWKVVYVANAEDASLDQVLDEVLVGPVPVGRNKFLLQAEAPLLEQVDATSILGVTVVLISCSYRGREFVRIGYYVNNEDSTAVPAPADKKEPGDKETGAPDGEPKKEQGEEPPAAPPAPKRPLDIRKVIRHIMADKPRVTKIPINWTAPEGQEDAAQGGGEPPLSPPSKQAQPTTEEEEEDALPPVATGTEEVDEEEYEDEEENPEEVDLEAEDEEEDEEEEEEVEDDVEGEEDQGAAAQDAGATTATSKGKRMGETAVPPPKKVKTG